MYLKWENICFVHAAVGFGGQRDKFVSYKMFLAAVRSAWDWIGFCRNLFSVWIPITGFIYLFSFISIYCSLWQAGDFSSLSLPVKELWWILKSVLLPQLDWPFRLQVGVVSLPFMLPSSSSTHLHLKKKLSLAFCHLTWVIFNLFVKVYTNRCPLTALHSFPNSD